MATIMPKAMMAMTSAYSIRSAALVSRRSTESNRFKVRIDTFTGTIA